MSITLFCRYICIEIYAITLIYIVHYINIYYIVTAGSISKNGVAEGDTNTYNISHTSYTYQMSGGFKPRNTSRSDR